MNLKLLRTAASIRFGVSGDRPAKPAPTLFAFAGSVEDSLTLPQFNRVGLLLERHGALIVSVDLPGYAEAIRPGDSGDPSGTDVPKDWRAWLERGDDLLGDYLRRATAALDHLIREGYTDPDRVAVYGISRGAFFGLHWAARDPRVRAIAAFAPLIDLVPVREFHALENHGPTRAVALIHQAERLAGRSLWVGIGNSDDRVDTGRAVEFTRAVVRATAAARPPPATPDEVKPIDVELHLLASVGHGLPATAEPAGAAWLAKRLIAPAVESGRGMTMPGGPK